MTDYWVVLALAAFVVGFSKTSIGGMGAFAVALFALVMPTRESTAAVLLVLIVGDVVAVVRYRGHADWRLIRGLLPSVLPGIVAGALVLAVVDDTTLRRLIGVILLVLVGLQLLLRRGEPPRWVAGRLGGHAAGAAAGFATMTANVAGAVMTVFLVSRRVDKLRFVATGAWFFFVVNLSKVPFSAALGLFETRMFVEALLLVPAVMAGAAGGIALVRRLDQRWFEIAVLSGSVVSAAALLVR